MHKATNGVEVAGKSTKAKARELGISTGMMRRKARQKKVKASKPGGRDWVFGAGSGGGKKKGSKRKGGKKR